MAALCFSIMAQNDQCPSMSSCRVTEGRLGWYLFLKALKGVPLCKLGPALYQGSIGIKQHSGCIPPAHGTPGSCDHRIQFSQDVSLPFIQGCASSMGMAWWDSHAGLQMSQSCAAHLSPVSQPVCPSTL